MILYETKNKRQRLLPLNDVALEIIDGHMTRKENFIFFQEKNPKKKYEKVSKVFRKAVYLCKLKKLSFFQSLQQTMDSLS